MKREIATMRRLPWRHLVRNVKPNPSFWSHQFVCFFWPLGVFPLADMCIEKSLLLLRFPPCGDSDKPKAAEGNSAPLRHSNSISEVDFQASSSVGSPSGVQRETIQTPGAQARDSSSGDQSMPENKGSGENLSTQPGQPAVPTVIPHKTPFSRSRLRLLSCRSIEEPSMASSVKDRYPIVKHILNFIRDQGVTTARWLAVSGVLISNVSTPSDMVKVPYSFSLLSLVLYRHFAWAKPRLWVCARSWTWCSSVYVPWESHTSSRLPASSFCRSYLHARKTSLGKFGEISYHLNNILPNYLNWHF